MNSLEIKKMMALEKKVKMGLFNKNDLDWLDVHLNMYKLDGFPNYWMEPITDKMIRLIWETSHFIIDITITLPKKIGEYSVEIKSPWNKYRKDIDLSSEDGWRMLVYHLQEMIDIDKELQKEQGHE